MRGMLLVLVCTVCLAHSLATADLMPPGHKGVTHELVFEDSELFDGLRIVAAPVAGFSGVTMVEPGVPFGFSTKYGTRFYLLPEDVPTVDDFDRERFAAWISCPPPRSEIKSVPLTNAVARALTILRLVTADGSDLIVEEVSHLEVDKAGVPVTGIRTFQTTIILVTAGLAICAAAFLALRWRANRRVAALPTEPTGPR